VQVRRRADSWYLDTAEPLTETPGVGEPATNGTWTFDPFKYLIDQAHARGIEVHAFVIMRSRLPRRSDNPGAPAARPAARLSSARLGHHHERPVSRPAPVGHSHSAGTTPPARLFDGRRYGADWYIDLGHPQAAAYTIDVLMKLVDDYDIDGLHLDRIRYPEAPADRGVERNVGYNDTSVARFKAHYGDQATYYTAEDVGSKKHRHGRSRLPTLERPSGRSGGATR